MYYLKAIIKEQVSFISCGHFISDEPWIHSKRNLDSFEVIICTRGTVFIQQDDERFEVTEGSFLLLLPGHTHRGYAISEQAVSFYWMHFKCRGEYEVLDEKAAVTLMNPLKINPSFGGLADSVLVPVFLQARNHDRLTILFRQLLHSANSCGYTPCVLDYLLTIILMELTQQSIDSAGEKTPEYGDGRIDTMIEWLRINLDKEISVSELAERFNLDKDYLTRWFKSRTGEPVRRYINCMKMLRAKVLLCDSLLNVKDIAYSLGFKDEKYFMKLFKSYENLTPSEYRNSFYKTHLNNN
jgi:AraC-like DNA-binding protein